MAGKSLGIEIGDHNLKIIECSRKTGAITSTAVTQILPDAIVQNGRIMAYNAMGSLLRETLKDNRIRSTAASVVLPMDSYFIKRVQLPVMTVKQLQINLPYEFHDYINDDMSHYVYDYAVLGIHKGETASGSAAGGSTGAGAGAQNGAGAAGTPQSDVMDLMIAACPKELVNNYTLMCRRAGLKLVKLVPDVLALQTLVFPPDEYEKRLAEEAAAEKEEQKRLRAQEKAEQKQSRKHTKKDKVVEEELARLGAASGGENAAGGGTGTAAQGGIGSMPGIIAGDSGTPAQNAAVSGGGRAEGGTSSAGTASGRVSSQRETQWQDYAILDFGHTGTRLHFFSKGAYEITRTMTTSARTVAEQLAQKRGVDIHIAELMLANNQDNVLKDPQVMDAYDTMATEIQRVMNFYSYSNPRNTIDRIYYFGDGMNAGEMGTRITDAIGLELHPLTELIPEAGDDTQAVLLAPQAYGAIFE